MLEKIYFYHFQPWCDWMCLFVLYHMIQPLVDVPGSPCSFLTEIDLGGSGGGGEARGKGRLGGMREMRNFSQDVIYERKKLKIKWKYVFMCWFLNIFAKCTCLVYLIYTLITRQTIWFLAFSVTQTFASSSLSSHESDYKYHSNSLQMEGITKFCKISLGFKN